MKKNKNFILLNPFIFTFVIFFKESLCLDYFYEACAPRNCGDGHNITYPFYIPALQGSYCGYPGFELNCSNNGEPVLQMADNKFIVRDIYYNNSSVRLLNAAVSSNSTNSSCLSAIKNITFDPSRFQFDNVTTSKLVLYSNCSDELPDGITRYRVGSCDKDTELLMIVNETNLGIGKEFCSGGPTVEIPVDMGEGEGRTEVVDGENYMEVMRRGFMMRWKAADCNRCERSGGRCGFNEATFNFRCFCSDRPHMVSCKSSGGHRKAIVISVVAGFAAFILVLSSAIFIYRRRCKRDLFSYFSSKSKSQDPEDGSVYFGVPVFSYAELEEATKNFNPSEELGDGGFGTVYYGKLRDGREVAVKRLYEHNYKRVQQFMNEVDILTRLRHRNLVLLYGCTSRRSRELLLVYEYIPNGTVADHLHGERANPRLLTWPLRMSIAIETASALAYLHASEIIHRDVKTNNILLDHNFCVKVADFGLSRLLPNDVTHVSTAPQGTPGYVDPQYHQFYQLTEKSDVYSFGVVLIELISSMPAVDISRSRDEINLANLAINRIQRCAFDQLIDPSLGSDKDAEIERMTTSVAELAFRCLQFDSDMRPTMNEVLEVLKEIQKQEGVEENDSVGEFKHVKPPPSPETEDIVLLKNFPPSPVSVADKWVSNSSISTTSTTISG